MQPNAATAQTICAGFEGGGQSLRFFRLLKYLLFYNFYPDSPLSSHLSIMRYKIIIVPRYVEPRQCRAHVIFGKKFRQYAFAKS